MQLFYAFIGLIVYFIVGRVVTDIFVKNGIVYGHDGFEKFLSNLFYPVIAIGILIIKAGDLIYRGLMSIFHKKDTDQNEKK
jgi:hypothetical protein